MNTDTPIIEIKNLTRRYGKLDAVNGLSLTVRAGKCYGFFGRRPRVFHIGHGLRRTSLLPGL